MRCGVVRNRAPTTGRLADQHHALWSSEGQRRRILYRGRNVAGGFKPGAHVVNLGTAAGALRPIAAGLAIAAPHRSNDNKAAVKEPPRRLAFAADRPHAWARTGSGWRTRCNDDDTRRCRTRRSATPRLKEVTDSTDVERHPMDLRAPQAFRAAGRTRRLRRGDADPCNREKQAKPPPHLPAR